MDYIEDMARSYERKIGQLVMQIDGLEEENQQQATTISIGESELYSIRILLGLDRDAGWRDVYKTVIKDSEGYHKFINDVAEAIGIGHGYSRDQADNVLMQLAIQLGAGVIRNDDGTLTVDGVRYIPAATGVKWSGDGQDWSDGPQEFGATREAPSLDPDQLELDYAEASEPQTTEEFDKQWNEGTKVPVNLFDAKDYTKIYREVTKWDDLDRFWFTHANGNSYYVVTDGEDFRVETSVYTPDELFEQAECETPSFVADYKLTSSLPKPPGVA